MKPMSRFANDAIRIPKTAELVARQIRNSIIRGDLKDGDKLPAEAVLISNFEVSRPTIREAVRILESEGLVSVSRGARGGATINSPNYHMIARAAGVTLQAHGVTIGDLYEMRVLLEPPAARLVAERNAKAGVPLLRAQIEKVVSLIGQREEMMPELVEFHRLMIELAGNRTLIMVWQALAGLVEQHVRLAARRYDEPRDEVRKRLRAGIKSKTKLVDFIEARDGEGAESHWRKHMISAGDIWLQGFGPASVVDLLD